MVTETVFEVCMFQNRLALLQPKYIQTPNKMFQWLPVLSQKWKTLKKAQKIKSVALFQESVTEGGYLRKRMRERGRIRRKGKHR